MIIQSKDGFDSLVVTGRQQTWIVRLSNGVEDECVILISAPAHTWSAYLCVFQTFAEVRIRDSTKPVSHLCCLQIRIQLHRHRGRLRFHVKFINGVLDRVLMIIRRAYRSISWSGSAIHPIGPQHTVGISRLSPLWSEWRWSDRNKRLRRKWMLRTWETISWNTTG